VLCETSHESFDKTRGSIVARAARELLNRQSHPELQCMQGEQPIVRRDL
jgi:hypothetical protein